MNSPRPQRRPSGKSVDGHVVRKRFGQNFLHDERVIQQIVASFTPIVGQAVVEIGPGLAALTKFLLPAVKRLHVIELDRDLAARLPKTLEGLGELIIHSGDALKFDFNTLASAEAPIRVIGNLPYNISTPLIFHLLSHSKLIVDMTFMLQKEVVDRLCASPGDSAYGRLSVMAQYRCLPEWLFDVPPEAFTPPPKVMSAIIRLTPHATLPHPCRDEKLLAEVVGTAFTMRRKTLRNALGKYPQSALETAGVDLRARPETLSVADYVAITHTLLDEPT
jgi:16S rRNA (adenine1518-N6/adenine1519-N6)-dimethyltransferase